MSHLLLSPSISRFSLAIQRLVRALISRLPNLQPEPVFVNLLSSPGIDSQPGGIDFWGSLNFKNAGPVLVTTYMEEIVEGEDKQLRRHYV
jgi:hypothetical protein